LIIKRVVIFSLSFLLASSLQADIFAKGKSNLGLSVGAASSYGETYTVVGLSGHYFVADNVSIAGYYRGWLGASPSQNELSVGVNYFLPLVSKVRPYAGLFVREHFVSGYDDFTAYGVRGGVSVISGGNSFVSLGYAYESYTNCQYDGECSNSYPEIIVGVSF
jgi:hypothetical protein